MCFLYLKFQDFFGREMLFDCNGIVIVIVISAGPSSLLTARNSALNLKKSQFIYFIGSESLSLTCCKLFPQCNIFLSNVTLTIFSK